MCVCSGSVWFVLGVCGRVWVSRGLRFLAVCALGSLGLVWSLLSRVFWLVALCCFGAPKVKGILGTFALLRLQK